MPADQTPELLGLPGRTLHHTVSDYLPREVTGSNPLQMVRSGVAADNIYVQHHLAAPEIPPVCFDKHFSGPHMLVQEVGRYTASVS